MKIITSLLLVLAVVCLDPVTARISSPKCFIELSRLLLPVSSYSLFCKCESDVGRVAVFTDGPSKPMDTVGRGEATLQCIERSKKSLVELCNRASTAPFEREAKLILERCVQQVKLTEQQLKRNGPFSFDRSTCTSAFKWGPVPSENLINAAWICECKQTDILEVLPGWAQYNITGELGGLGRELQLLRTCSETEAESRLERVCQESPGNFLILGLQIIQTCCKRARVNASTKFGCAAVVPTDLSEYKREI